MNSLDQISAAAANALRSRTRTLLTVVAIVIGAFTLTLTSAIGTGVNHYIDTTVATIGADDVITVTKNPADTAAGPQPYDPDARTVAGGEDPDEGTQVEAITSADLTRLAAVDGVLSVRPSLTVQPDYVQAAGDGRYQATIGGFVPGMSLNLEAGTEPAAASPEPQVAIPVDYVGPLGFASPHQAVGQQLTTAVTDAQGTTSTVGATIVGVSAPTLVGGTSLTPNDALTAKLHDRQRVGLPDRARDSHASAVLRFDTTRTDAQVADLKTQLTGLGYDARTVEDDIGSFRPIIDGVVLALNGFALIALLAAGFGIVNTLLMSVKERTREIGLMKAVGMPNHSIFGLFSYEATFIGLLGSVAGVGLAALTGLLGNRLLGGLTADLPGLEPFGFAPLPILGIVVVVMGIAFLAGTIPAARAARQDPIDALRYE